jgi:DeoR family transcriptional regulator, aga operon transcriptional repressor
MLAAERRSRIISAVRSNGAVTLADLARSLQTSVSTLRRDVDYLDRTGLVTRTRGGAVARAGRSMTFEPAADVAATLFAAEKRAIGQRAAAHIRNGQTVMFDSGTTTLEAATAALGLGPRFTAVTNDLRIGALLSASPDIEVVVPGGVARPGSPTLLGSATHRFIASLRLDLVLLGTHAAQDLRLADTSVELAQIKHVMIENSQRAILLADSSKFRQQAFVTFAEIDELDLLITDTAIEVETQDALAARGVAVDRVQVRGSRGA